MTSGVVVSFDKEITSEERILWLPFQYYTPLTGFE